MNRLRKPEEIAATSAFLASDDASLVTGQTLFVDGGGSLENRLCRFSSSHNFQPIP